MGRWQLSRAWDYTDATSMRVRHQIPHFRLGVHGCIWLCGGAAGDEPAQPTLERERCQVGPEYAGWHMHSCGNTAIKS